MGSSTPAGWMIGNRVKLNSLNTTSSWLLTAYNGNNSNSHFGHFGAPERSLKRKNDVLSHAELTEQTKTENTEQHSNDLEYFRQ